MMHYIRRKLKVRIDMNFGSRLVQYFAGINYSSYWYNRNKVYENNLNAKGPTKIGPFAILKTFLHKFEGYFIFHTSNVV